MVNSAIPVLLLDSRERLFSLPSHRPQKIRKEASRKHEWSRTLSLGLTPSSYGSPTALEAGQGASEGTSSSAGTTRATTLAVKAELFPCLEKSQANVVLSWIKGCKEQQRWERNYGTTERKKMDSSTMSVASRTVLFHEAREMLRRVGEKLKEKGIIDHNVRVHVHEPLSRFPCPFPATVLTGA
jgi:hypothetical protein